MDTHICTHIHIATHTYIDRQTDRQTDKHKYTLGYVYYCQQKLKNRKKQGRPGNEASHAVCTLWVHPPTSPCPALSAIAEPISQGHFWKSHDEVESIMMTFGAMGPKGLIPTHGNSLPHLSPRPPPLTSLQARSTTFTYFLNSDVSPRLSWRGQCSHL